MKIFDWGPGIMSESMFGGFMQRYGPYALETEFCNYGEPLLNPKTPQLIRLAKTYLVRTMLSTNIGVKHFDPEAYVNSGLDYMTISIDGATQSVYEKFRKKGDIETVFKNVRNLIQTKKRLGKRTPMVSWQFLAFEHNQHEIDDAIKLAQEFGVDQLMVGAPFDVSFDDPNVRPSQQVARTVVFNPEAGEGMIENWNPVPFRSPSRGHRARIRSPVGANAFPKTLRPSPDPASRLPPYLPISLQKHRDGWPRPHRPLLRRPATRHGSGLRQRRIRHRRFQLR